GPPRCMRSCGSRPRARLPPPDVRPRRARAAPRHARDHDCRSARRRRETARGSSPRRPSDGRGGGIAGGSRPDDLDGATLGIGLVLPLVVLVEAENALVGVNLGKPLCTGYLADVLRLADPLASLAVGTHVVLLQSGGGHL